MLLWMIPIEDTIDDKMSPFKMRPFILVYRNRTYVTMGSKRGQEVENRRYYHIPTENNERRPFF